MSDELLPPRHGGLPASLNDPNDVLAPERPLRLGRYRMIARVGSGGGATVYLALASGAAGVNKLLVVKVLKEELAEDPALVAMFLDEARLSTRLNHPNIVQMLEVGRESGHYFLVMEYLEGKPLSRLGGVPGIGRDVLLHMIAEALGGLHYAHELTDYDGTPLRVVHRDFSPPNVFVTFDGHAKLLDFGVAKMLLSSVTTEIDVLKGKPRYMAPEQMAAAEIDRRADVFSAGIVLWEAIAGRRMWTGKNDLAVLYAVGSGRIPRLDEVAPRTPPELVKIVHRALAPAREDRHPTALALQEDLEVYLRRSSEVVKPRDVGRVLRAHFAADRAQINAAVEAQLRALANESRAFRVVSLPEIETGTLGGPLDTSDARISSLPELPSVPPSDPKARVAPLSDAPTVAPAPLEPASRLWFVGAAAIAAATVLTVSRVVPGWRSREPAATSAAIVGQAAAARSALPPAPTPQALARDAGASAAPPASAGAKARFMDRTVPYAE